MKRVTTNQDLIVGRRYLTRDIPVLLFNGSYSKPEIKIQYIGEDSGRRYVGKHKMWAYDRHDGIISWNGKQRLEAEAKAMNLPVSEMSVIPEDYEVNSQALERWEMIGPIPDVKEGLLHSLFDYPDFLKCFNRAILLNCNGDLGLQLDPEEDVFAAISSIEDIKLFFDNDPSEADVETTNPNCENIEVPMAQSAMNNKPQFQKDMLPESMFIRYNPQEMIGKYVRLTENKYGQVGYFPKGSILLVAGFRDGFLLKEEKSELVINGVDDGFEFIDYGYKQEPTSWNSLTGNHGRAEFPPNAFGHPKFSNNPSPLLQAMQQLDAAVDISIGIAIGYGAPNMGLFAQPGYRKTKEDKKHFLEQYLQYLSTQPY